MQPHQPTIAAYNAHATTYDQEVITFWENFPHEFLEAFASRLKGKRVLNIGSGSGRDAVLLRDLGLEVICLDASQKMVDMTTKLGFESHLSTFDTMEQLEGTFDGVWAYTSLIHVPAVEATAAITTIHSFLKHGGIFAIGVIEGQGSETVEQASMPDASRFFQYYSSNELKVMVEDAGFSFVHESRYQPNRKVYLNQLYVQQ